MFLWLAKWRPACWCGAVVENSVCARYKACISIYHDLLCSFSI